MEKYYTVLHVGHYSRHWRNWNPADLLKSMMTFLICYCFDFCLQCFVVFVVFEYCSTVLSSTTVCIRIVLIINLKKTLLFLLLSLRAATSRSRAPSTSSSLLQAPPFSGSCRSTELRTERRSRSRALWPGWTSAPLDSLPTVREERAEQRGRVWRRCRLELTAVSMSWLQVPRCPVPCCCWNSWNVMFFLMKQTAHWTLRKTYLFIL